MLTKDVKDLLNAQINKELYSAYLYLDMANYYLSESLNGFGNWFTVQVKEEMSHAELIMTYLLNNGETIKLDEIKAPDIEFKNFKDPLVAAYSHEQFVTASINTIYEAALKDKDFRTIQFLDWFVKEQGEEEKNTDDLVKRFTLFGNDPKGLYELDNELSTRVFTPPSLVL